MARWPALTTERFSLLMLLAKKDMGVVLSCVLSGAFVADAWSDWIGSPLDIFDRGIHRLRNAKQCSNSPRFPPRDSDLPAHI